MSTLREGRALTALAWLVELKDGPRDAAYEEQKPRAWSLAREVLADPEPVSSEALSPEEAEALMQATDEYEGDPEFPLVLDRIEAWADRLDAARKGERAE